MSSATITQINAAHQTNHERLMAASLKIIRLEAQTDLLRLSLTHAIDTLELLATTIALPPCPMPKAAAGIGKTVRALKEQMVKAEEFAT